MVRSQQSHLKHAAAGVGVSVLSGGILSPVGLTYAGYHGYKAIDAPSVNKNPTTRAKPRTHAAVKPKMVKAKR